ncbi:DUF3291 domain-containing protein [Thalassotalea sp. PS06]|uniref:DUF3291 domain-containing protein n=1 Tax=Thalassotalea sp. PS06 TaxID=2594005 RepID=UPI00116235E3|nr:DUF3291 domain-containing protein [Thalassotalea sp. PS06]QDP01229.1 DUF3291 domain-containing protein [Thalassotalea sp. PS06]
MTIAQLNIAKAKRPLTDPRMSGFTDHLDRINQLAEDSAGFIWRFIDDENNSQTLSVLKDPLVIANLSLWQSASDLKKFAYGTEHRNFVKNRGQWFESLEQASLVLWFHEDGQPPSLEEAVNKLQLYRQQGNTPQAFNFAYALNHSES